MELGKGMVVKKEQIKEPSRLQTEGLQNVIQGLHANKEKETRFMLDPSKIKKISNEEIRAKLARQQSAQSSQV